MNEDVKTDYYLEKEKQATDIQAQKVNVIKELRWCLESISLDEENSSGSDQVWMRTFSNKQRDKMADKLMEMIDEL